MSQKPNSNNLSENRVPNGDNILSEHQNMAGKETRESTNISSQNDLLKDAAKADEINDANKSIDQNIEGAPQGYSPPENVNPDVLVQWVLRESYLQTNEDLKEYAEKIKTGNKTDPPGGNTQDEQVTAQLVSHVNAFVVDIELPNKKNKRVLSVILIMGIISLTTVAIVGLRKIQSPAKASKGPSQIGNNPPALVMNPTSASNCSIRFTSPTNTAELPNFGPVLFEWNNVPAAISYSLEVAPPNDLSLPWTYAVDGNSKKVYMENFPMGGTFLISINALSSDEKVLCRATLTFNKKTLVVADDNSINDNDSNDEAAPVSTPCVNTGIAYYCP